MRKLLLVICMYISFCACTERNRREINEPSSKILTSFRNFETCVNNFDIHNDKIIRTEDSRAMGAKYISETDIGTREECLRLCCVTDTCDVFIFEEKRPGSCYLFNCGSSSNFKCKFTKHHNYTSGVLTLSQQVRGAQEQDTSSKHEQELNQLRKPDRNSLVNLNTTSATPSNSQTSLQKSSQKLNKTEDQSPLVTLRCSRFQFKCRTSGECIAIYNACDGIPQCSDDSDESGCPAPATPSLVSAAPSTRNKTEDESFIKPFINLYHVPPQKILLPDNFENVRREDFLERTSTSQYDQSLDDQLQNRRSEMSLSAGNILNEHEINRKILTNEYQNEHENFFKKPEDSSQRNRSPEFSGFHQYSNPHGEQKSDNVDTKEHNYIAAKLISEQRNVMEHNRYEQKSQNRESQIKSGFFPQQPDTADLQKSSEVFTMFENIKHASKLRPPLQLGFKPEQSELGNGFHSQTTNMRVSGMQRNEYQNEHSEKDQLSSRNEAYNSLQQHTVRLKPQQINTDKSGSHNEEYVEMRSQHQHENGIKKQVQLTSFQNAELPNVPDTSYKFEGEGRHLFNHKGYGLVADSESSEIPYRNSIGKVQYKLNNTPKDGFAGSMPSHGSQLQRNSWTEELHPKTYVSKGAKTNPQSFDAESGFPLSSDYLFDEGQHSNWNAVSLIPHPPDTDHHLSTSSASSLHTRRPLERPNVVAQTKSHREHLHDIIFPPSGSNKLVSSDSKRQDNSQDFLISHFKSIDNAIGGSFSRNIPESHTSANKDGEHNHVQSHHQEHFISLQKADVSEPSNDKQQERPSGALLSLSFGLCVTFLMIILVACRLRVVKRRLRRNGKSHYAHDADYLVNGMYL